MRTAARKHPGALRAGGDEQGNASPASFPFFTSARRVACSLAAATPTSCVRTFPCSAGAQSAARWISRSPDYLLSMETTLFSADASDERLIAFERICRTVHS